MISLVPQTLREASLDSPTFRGTVSHYAEQIDLLEKWIDGCIKASSKMVHDILGMEDVINNFLVKAVPMGISESVIDPDYTLTAVRKYIEGSRGFWINVIKAATKVDKVMVEPMVAFQKNELKNFKEIRRTLETAQSKYDNLVARYAAQSKSKEPSSLREDAFQLFEARKAYYKACFDFCVAAPTVRTAVDRIITKIVSDQWREQLILRKDTSIATERCNSDLERIRAWSDSLGNSERTFRNQLFAARTEMEERAKKEWQPARELEEYASSTVPYLTSRPQGAKPGNTGDQKDIPSEKQGYLFMRTLTGKPTRTVWIRRWFFVKSGIFGWLVQGYHKGGLEESEKVGVLLCNIKPAFQEDRRFCFEVKTKDTSVLLQAETQTDLTNWLEVFEQAKRAAVESASMIASNQAFSILPPSAPAPPSEPAYVTRGNEGLSSPMQSAFKESLKPHIPKHLHGKDGRGGSVDDASLGFDRTLTIPPAMGGRAASMDVNRENVPVPMGTREKIGQRLEMHRKAVSSASERASAAGGLASPSGISALIAASHSALMTQDPPKPNSPDFPLIRASTLAPETLVGTPAPTNLLKAAKVTSGNGLTITSPTDVHRVGPLGAKGHRKTISLDTTAGKGQTQTQEDTEYPSDYPPELFVQDEHFRMLFPNVDDGPLLLVFRATWSPSETQEIPGRCYVTENAIYYYSHHFGLVFSTTILFASVTEVKAAPEKDCDYIVLSLKPEENDTEVPYVTLKTFLEPLRLLQRRLQFLVSNATLDDDNEDKLGAKELLPKLIDLEKHVEEKATDTESWEDLAGLEDPHEDIVPRRKEAEFKLQLDTDMEAKQAGKDTSKFKLPAEPVVYVPKGMDRKTLEREFNVTPKALFHIIFGNKSPVFLSLYRGRRALEIKQAPWQASDDGKLQRRFTYKVDYLDLFGRGRRIDVLDVQSVEKEDEHLCYVIADLKTPWHLPYRENFKLASTVVITHVAKSKSRLAIWVSVAWTKDPKFSKGIVQRQALDDLESDAQDLGDITAAQIAKLGATSRTKKAMTLFGTIDPRHGSLQTATETDPATAAGAVIARKSTRTEIRHKSLAQMQAETLLSFSESALSTVVMWLVSAITTIAEFVSAQWILIIVLLLSIGTNMLLGTRSTMAYWGERRAARFVEEIGIKPNGIMSRSVHLRDLDEMVRDGSRLAVDPSSQCYTKFRDLLTQSDIDDTSDILLASSFALSSTRATARRLRSSRQVLGSYRHDLLVAVRVVNSFEKDLIRAEWENWLVEEAGRCVQARDMLREKEAAKGDQGGRGKQLRKWLDEYCGSCRGEMKAVEEGGLKWEPAFKGSIEL